MTRLIDLMHLGRDRVIAAHERPGGVIVDPGPASTLAALEAGLESEPRVLLLTHIHLDHAGAAGALVRRFPGLRVYVSAVGAPHLVDPSRLLRSAARLYGEREMARLWGEVAPVPAERVSALAGGEVVERMRVLRAPGHAAHHVVFHDPDSGEAFVGDVAGVRIAPSELTIAPTPPPEIDVEAWLTSLATLRSLDASRLHLTHFGPVEDVAAQLDRVEAALRGALEAARAGRERFGSHVESELEAAGPEAAERLRQAAPPEQLWLGLERYIARGG
jgi:glyoxylase-like metal-dependent hydrolase (beta-lactamase superfamily II)